jgi:ABC-2 type transport system permease protein
MRRLIAAEFDKLFTTRLWLWLLLASVALTALYASLAIAFSDNNPSNPTPPLTSVQGQNTLFSVGSGGATPFLVVLAAIGLTGEFRHRTASATFLAVPRRGRVVLAKLATYVVVGIGYAVTCLAVTFAIAVPWLSAKHIDILVEGKTTMIVGVVASVAIFGLIGVGLGALLREQVATVVGALIYLFVAEPIVTRIPDLNDWTRFLPGSARYGLISVSQNGLDLLAPWQGGLVLAAYGVLFTVAGSYLTMRRDIT